MRYRRLDDEGDYCLGTGADWLSNTPEAVAQAVMTRLRLHAGDWFTDTEDGTPWRTEVLGKYTLSTYDAVIKSRILDTPGVIGIEGYTSEFNGQTRRLTVSATVTTEYGSATASGPI